MSFPSQAEEQALHERVLQGDPVAPADVFQAFIEPIVRVLCSEMGCTREDAYDATIDVVVSYLSNPERYDRHRARLSTYLTKSATKGVIDRRRSADARTRREQEFATVVELLARSPKEDLELSVEARLALERLDDFELSEMERAFLRAVLQGERSTQRLAEIVGLGSLPEEALRREVKRFRDRLMKKLERRGKEDADEKS